MTNSNTNRDFGPRKPCPRHPTRRKTTLSQLSIWTLIWRATIRPNRTSGTQKTNHKLSNQTSMGMRSQKFVWNGNLGGKRPWALCDLGHICIWALELKEREHWLKIFPFGSLRFENQNCGIWWKTLSFDYGTLLLIATISFRGPKITSVGRAILQCPLRLWTKMQFWRLRGGHHSRYLYNKYV